MLTPMVQGFSNSAFESGPPVGMSDEEELRRYGQQVVDAGGFGDVLFEMDASELGLAPE